MATDERADRSASTDALWADVKIDPLEIALPGGVGYTLRAYRPADEIAPNQGGPDTVELDDFDAAAAVVGRRRDADEESEIIDEFADEDEDDERSDRDESTEDEEDEEDEEEDDDKRAEQASTEDVPIFLGRKGRLYLFHSPEKLVEFVRSDADHDLAQLDTWSDLSSRITVDDVVPAEDDTYELDLVVDNLRGGPDAWDASLILKAGEIARDVGFALRLDPILMALAAGSPLDDLDETLRTAENGGVGAFFARRKLKKIPSQQSSLAWRTLIGKISAAADWRD